MVGAFNGGARVNGNGTSIACNCISFGSLVFRIPSLTRWVSSTASCQESFGAVMKDTGTVASVQCFHTVPTGYCQLKDCGPKDAVEVIPIGHSRDTCTVRV
jgi:hypothetical protein